MGGVRAETPDGPEFEPPGGLWAVIAIVLGIAAAIAVFTLVFWVVRDVPSDRGCGGFEPPGHDAAVDDYRSGAIVLHLLFAVAIGAGIAWSSWQRNVMTKGRRAVGAPTLACLGLLAVFVLTSLGQHDFFLALGIPALGAVAFPTVPVAALISLAICGVVLAFPATPNLRMRREAECAGWLMLIVWLPASIVQIYLQGEGPLFC